MKKRIAVQVQETATHDQAYIQQFSAKQATLLNALTENDFTYFTIQDGKLYYAVVPTADSLSTAPQPVTGHMNLENHECYLRRGYLDDITEDALPYTIPLQNGGKLTITKVVNGKIIHMRGSLMNNEGTHYYQGTFKDLKPYDGHYYSQHHTRKEICCRQQLKAGIPDQNGELYHGSLGDYKASDIFYTGTIRASEAHGEGRLQTDDVVINGHFNHGVISGEATCLYTNILNRSGPSFRQVSPKPSIETIHSLHWENDRIPPSKLARIMYTNRDLFIGTVKHLRPTANPDYNMNYTPKLGTLKSSSYTVQGLFDEKRAPEKTLYFKDAKRLCSVVGKFKLTESKIFQGTLTYTDKHSYTGTIKYNGRPTEDNFEELEITNRRVGNAEIFIDPKTNTRYTTTPTTSHHGYKKGSYNKKSGHKKGLFEVVATEINPNKNIQKTGLVHYKNNQATAVRGWYTDLGLDNSFFSPDFVDIHPAKNSVKTPKGYGIQIKVTENGTIVTIGKHNGDTLDTQQERDPFKRNGLIMQQTNTPTTPAYAVICGEFNGQKPIPTKETSQLIMTNNTGTFNVWAGKITPQYIQVGEGRFYYNVEATDIFSTRDQEEDHGPTRSICHFDVTGIKAFEACGKNPIPSIYDVQYRHGVPDQTQAIEMHLGNRLWYKGGFRYHEQANPNRCEFIPNGQGHLVDLCTGKESQGKFCNGEFIEETRLSTSSKPNVSQPKSAEEAPSTSASASSSRTTDSPTLSSCWARVNHIDVFKKYQKSVYIVHKLCYNGDKPDTTKLISIQIDDKLIYRGGFIIDDQAHRTGGKPRYHYEYIPHGEGTLENLITCETKIGEFKKGEFVKGDTIVAKRLTAPSASARTYSHHSFTENGASSSSRPAVEQPRTTKKRKRPQPDKIETRIKHGSFGDDKTTPPANPNEHPAPLIPKKRRPPFHKKRRSAHYL